MKATGQTGNRQRATQKQNRAGKSALMMLNHPKNRKLYISPLSIGEKRAVYIAEVLTIFRDRIIKGKKGERKKMDAKTQDNQIALAFIITLILLSQMGAHSGI